MDFMEKLCDKINESPGLTPLCKMGYLDIGESFVLYPLPGSRVTQEYMDGTTDQQLNFEIAFKSRSLDKINKTLWAVQTNLENAKTIISKDGSFEFDELIIINKPFINQIDDQGWFVFLLNVQAKITIF